MDLLYARYSNPMDLIVRYINQGRLGTFVKDFLDAEYERKKEAAEKDQEWMLWVAYVHSYSDESFNDWKKKVLKPASTTRSNHDADMTDKDINGIMSRLFPE